LDVKDAVIGAVPDLIVFKKTCRRFLSYFHIEEISCFFVGERDEVIVPEKGKKTNDEDNENQRKGDTIEADPPCFKSSDLAMTGERAEGEEGGQQNRIGDRPLEGCFRDLIEEVFEHQVKRSLISMEEIHLLKEEDDNIDQDQTAQAQAENLQVFPYNISMNDTITFKHFQKAFSNSVE
jgi:hypothetical protein